VNYSGAHSRSWRVQSPSPLEHRTLSGGAPDSPVNYSGAPLRIPKGEVFRLDFPGAPDIVRWLGVKTGGYRRIIGPPVSYPNVFQSDSGSDTDS
jgi:hypothetical protein